MYMSRFGAWLILIFALGENIAFGVQPSLQQTWAIQHLRSDIKEKLEGRLCTDQQAPTIRELWQQGIYDAALQGHFMTTKEGMQTTPDLLAKAAAILAKRTDHNGFDFGVCNQTSTGWVITSPAAGNYARREEDGSIHLSWSSVRSYCHEAHIDYVAAAGGRARNLMVLTSKSNGGEVKIDDTFLSDGTVSITCYPKYGKNLGPELWFLLPVKAGPLEKAPGIEQLAKRAGGFDSSLLLWINDIRESAQLAPLKRLSSNSTRRIDTALLAKNETVHHDTAHLQSVQTMIHKSGGFFIGENRVKSENLEQMAWLLWNSPRHRDLLLTTKADSLAVNQIKGKTQQLVVLTFAKY